MTNGVRIIIIQRCIITQYCCYIVRATDFFLFSLLTPRPTGGGRSSLRAYDGIQAVNICIWPRYISCKATADLAIFLLNTIIARVYDENDFFFFPSTPNVVTTRTDTKKRADILSLLRGLHVGRRGGADRRLPAVRR